MARGYCTVPDVRRALQQTIADFDAGATGEDNNQLVVDAITAQTSWLRETTGKHFYVEGGLTEDDHDIVPTSADSRAGEEHDIPSTPHPQHSQLFVADRGRYPRQTNGPYTRIRLDKHYVDTLTALEVRDSGGGWVDWTADSTYSEGDDYELYVEPGDESSPSYVNLRTSRLPTLTNYRGAVRISYDYGLAELPSTIRRAVAFRAGSELILDDDAQIGIPDSGQLVSLESKAQAMERKADELLEAYR